MKKLNFAILGLALLILILFYACVNDKKKDTTKETALIEFAVDSIIEADEIFYRFPSPEEIFKYIESTDLNYNSGLLNSAFTYKKYLGLQKQSINLGIYISDLTYITMFEQHEASLDYFSSIHSLSEELKISAAFDKPLIERISDNIDNSDSLVVIASDAYQSIVDYLAANDQNDLLAIIATGTLVESLYLTLDYVQEYDAKNNLLGKILNQKFVVNNIYEFAKQHQNDNIDIKDFVQDLGKLNAIFENLKSVKKEVKKEEPKSNKLVIGGGSKLTISEEDFNTLKKLVSDIRNSYTSIEK